MHHTHHTGFGSFWVSTISIFVALVYLAGCFRLRSRDQRNLAGWRAGSFLIGLVFIWVATVSPLAALDHEILTAHMVQHLLLMTFAPPLILLGTPRKLLARGLPQRFAQIINCLFRSGPTQKLERALTHPILCWLGAAATLTVWHIPTVFTLSLRSELWHGIEQASFLAAGLLFWWPVLDPRAVSLKWPESSILLYLFLATLPCDVLSGFLVFCDRVVYPVYLSSAQPSGLSALEDQQCAAALMWTCVTIVYLIAAAIFTARMLSRDRSQELLTQQFESRRVSVAHTDARAMETI